MRKRYFVKPLSMGLVLAMLLCGGCGKAAETGAAGNGTPGGAAASDFTPAPTVEPTKSPEVTLAPEVTLVPEVTLTPTQTELPPTGTPIITPTPTLTPTPGPTVPAELLLVTPVPKEKVTDIAGSIAPEDYPVVDGSTATLPLSQAVYQLATGADSAAAEKAIVHTKTTNSYYQLYNGDADLLIVYEPPKEIIERMQTEELLVKPIGLDALVFMANAANPVESLTTEQLVDIYSGNIKNWAEVGGTKQELLAFQRPAGSGSQSLMQKLVMKDMPMESGDNVFRYATMSDILEGMLAYTGDNNTLGYSVFYYANYMYSLPELRFMAVDGVTPSSQTIYDGSYPFINAFYAVIRPDEPEDSNARRIFDWLTGEAGQQLVLDLGYVPVDKPEEAKLPDSIVQTAEEVELLQGYELAEGEHLIFHRLQEEIFEHEFPYGKLMIYDSNLKLRETFYNAYTYINDYEKSGRYDGRYLVIYQARVTANGETEYLSRIYDLQEYCFLDLPWTEDLNYVLDDEKGFYVCVNRGEEYDYRNAYRVVNFTGETLVDKICDFDYVGLRQEGNCYIAERYSADEYFGKGVYWIYDENLVLKNVIAEAEADLPSVEERQPDVEYWVLGETQNCYLDADGNMLLNQEIFDTTFGAVLGELPQEGFMTDGYPNVFDGAKNELLTVSYGEDYYYVDAMLNIYMKKGEEQLHFIQEPEERQEYYIASYGVKKTYFDSDGELLRMSDGVIPDIVLSYEKESYVMIHPGSDGTIVEEYRYGKELLGRYEYPWVMDQYSEIHYLGDAQLVVRSAGENAESENEMLKTLIYQGKEQIACLAAANNNLTRECYDENGTLCVQIIEGYYSGKQDKKYWMYRNGTLSYIGLSEDAYCYAKNSMIKLDYGNYTYMYDYDGKQIIKAYQLMKEE